MSQMMGPTQQIAVIGMPSERPSGGQIVLGILTLLASIIVIVLAIILGIASFSGEAIGVGLLLLCGLGMWGFLGFILGIVLVSVPHTLVWGLLWWGINVLIFCIAAVLVIIGILGPNILS